MKRKDKVKEAVEEARKKAAQKTQDSQDIQEENNPKDIEANSADTKEEASADDASDNEADNSREKETDSGHGKKDKKDEKIEELTDRLTRQMAEFDNFRKRTDREKSQMYEIGARDIIEKILPVVDNFERGLNAFSEEDKENPFAEGMEKIYKQLMTTLESLSVKPIEAVGQEFNPDIHNAVMHVEDESVGENIITEEFLKGYTYRETVVRHSMVKVAN